MFVLLAGRSVVLRANIVAFIIFVVTQRDLPGCGDLRDTTILALR